MKACSWLNVDILIMNYKIPLEIFLLPPTLYPHVNCVVTDDHRWLNNGGFFLRVNDWSVWLMTAVLGYQKRTADPVGNFGHKIKALSRTSSKKYVETLFDFTLASVNTICVATIHQLHDTRASTLVQCLRRFS